jgi:hypothetical protein
MRNFSRDAFGDGKSDIPDQTKRPREVIKVIDRNTTLIDEFEKCLGNCFFPSDQLPGETVVRNKEKPLTAEGSLLFDRLSGETGIRNEE